MLVQNVAERRIVGSGYCYPMARCRATNAKLLRLVLPSREAVVQPLDGSDPVISPQTYGPFRMDVKHWHVCVRGVVRASATNSGDRDTAR